MTFKLLQGPSPATPIIPQVTVNLQLIYFASQLSVQKTPEILLLASWASLIVPLYFFDARLAEVIATAAREIGILQKL